MPPGRSLHVVVEAHRGQPPARPALDDADPGLGRQVVPAPPDEVVLHRAAHAVVGHRARLHAHAAPRAEALGEVGVQLTGSAVGVLRADRLAEVPVRLERPHHRVGVAGLQRVPELADDAAGRPAGPGLQDRRPDLVPPDQRPLAAVGPEHHRPVVGGFGHHRQRPGHVPPVLGQVHHQLDHGLPADHGGGHRLRPRVHPGQPELVLADEVPHLPVPADLAGPRVVDHHVARPGRLQVGGVLLVQRGDVVPDRIGAARGARLQPGQLHGTGELRKPRHLALLLPPAAY